MTHTLASIITTADADADLTGSVTLTDEQWRVIRANLSASGRAALVQQLKKMVKQYDLISYARHHREAVEEAKRILSEQGEPLE